MIFSDVRLKNVDYVVRYTPSVPRFSAHNRPNHILGLKLTGASEHFFCDRRFMMDEDCIYFLNQSEDYRVENHSYGECLSVHFTAYEPIAVAGFCLKIREIFPVLSLLEELERLHQGGEIHSPYGLSVFYRLLHLFEQLLHREQAQLAPRLKRAKEYLTAHSREKDCMDRAAEECGVSRRRFNDLFFHAYGVTPHRFLTEGKMAMAKSMLRSGGMSVQAIAEHCGFSDVYYFSKRFKQETGFSPTDYKKKS